MTAFYTERERKAALKQMRLNPDIERVNSTDAAKILTWRAKAEHEVEHEYHANAVRKHADQLDSQPARRKDGSVNIRQNIYSVKKLFEIDIAPQRTNKGNRKTVDKGIDKVLTIGL